MTFNVWRSHPDKSEVIITAGVDGDEYAGIEAAQELIKEFSQNNPSIPLTIIPIVNQEGYKKGVDYNPVDGRYPKHIYPGFPLGSTSVRLMWQLSRIVRGHKFWLDLHGGNSQEHLTPFLWADQTSLAVDHLNNYLMSKLSYPTLFSRNLLAPSKYLSKSGTAYLLFECGEMGLTDRKYVNAHKNLVKSVLKLYSHYSSNYNVSFSPTYTHLSQKKGQIPSPPPHNLLWNRPDYYTLGN